MKPQSLSAQERIKSKKDFELLFTKGKSFLSQNQLLKAVYYFEFNSTSPGIKIAAGINKKTGKAVWRNRVKRLIKESYRLNKNILLPWCIQENVLVKIIFVSHRISRKYNKKITYGEIEECVLELLNKIKNAG